MDLIIFNYVILFVIAQAKRELERKLFDLQTTADEADRSTERKLKKELKKLRILYKDAKQALDSQVSVYISRGNL